MRPNTQLHSLQTSSSFSIITIFFVIKDNWPETYRNYSSISIVSTVTRSFCGDKEIKSKKGNTRKMKRISLLIVLFASLTVAGKVHA